MSWKSLTGLVLAPAVLALWVGCNESTSSNDTPTNPTTPTALITLTAPVTGQSFKIGEKVQIRWKVKTDTEDPVYAVDIFYSPDDGKEGTWAQLNDGSVFNTTELWGDYPWTIPESLWISATKPKISSVGSKGIIKVEQYSTGDANKIAKTGYITVTAK